MLTRSHHFTKFAIGQCPSNASESVVVGNCFHQIYCKRMGSSPMPSHESFHKICIAQFWMLVDDRLPRMGKVGPVGNLPHVASKHKGIVRMTRVSGFIAALV